MNPAAKSSAIVAWHHRVLGALWALCSLVPTIGAFAHSPWSGPFFISVVVSAICVGTSIGFILGRTWARRAMCVLLLIAALSFFDMLLMFGAGGNHFGVGMMLGARGLAAYTFVFLAISALYEPKGST